MRDIATETATAHTHWPPGEREYTVGIEEEACLVDPADGAIAHRSAACLPALAEALTGRVTAETHDSAFEFATAPCGSVAEAVGQVRAMRADAAGVLNDLGLAACVAGTHPTATWEEVRVSEEPRYERVHDAMGELARREPTFALHVHVGIGDADRAIRACDRLRVHLPLLLALSANSPYYQGRDSRLASARTPIFQAFPRTGIPRPFGDWEGYRRAIEPLVNSGAIPDSSHLWWDIRPKDAIGTIEVRIMDAQTSVMDTATLTALTLALTHLELEEGFVSDRAIEARETIEENRFRAARDGIMAGLIDADSGAVVAMRDHVATLLERCEDHAADLGCSEELAGIDRLLDASGADRQRQRSGGGPKPDLAAVTSYLIERYLSEPAPSRE
jgi:carboxylate-amine ligase